MDEEKIISASFIIEILGRPKEHVSDSLKNLIDELDKEKGANVVEKTLHEPRELEEKDKDKEIEEDRKLFTSFAEVEADFENLGGLLTVVFKYMPSNIEIIKPETFVFKNDYLGEVLTGIILKLHRYDEIAKKLTTDNYILKQRVMELLDKKNVEDKNEES